MIVNRKWCRHWWQRKLTQITVGFDGETDKPIAVLEVLKMCLHRQSCATETTQESRQIKLQTLGVFISKNAVIFPCIILDISKVTQWYVFEFQYF
jgi:hypothetical protein